MLDTVQELWDRFEDGERYLLVGALALMVVAGFGAGYVTAGGSGPAAAGDTDQIRSQVQAVVDQQVSRQRQQLRVTANRSANLSMDDMSISASVTSVEPSQFGSLYRATISYSGEIPSRTGEIRSMDQDQELFISSDGRYLFRPPTDLSQPSQPRQPAQ